MGLKIITGISAVVDSVDRLEWRVRISTDFYGTEQAKAFILNWEGRVSFYLRPVPSNGMPGAETAKRTLTARLLNYAKSARLTMPHEVALDFATDLPGDALDRIQHFRGENPLYCRLEGFLTLATEYRGSLTNGFANLMGDHQVVAGADVWSEPFDLQRDWPRVCAELRPSGRFLMIDS